MSNMKLMFLGLALMTSSMIKAAAAAQTNVYVEVDASCPPVLSLVKAEVDGKSWDKGADEPLGIGSVFRLSVLNNGAEHTLNFTVRGPGADLGYPDCEVVTIDPTIKLLGVVGGELYYKLLMTGDACPIRPVPQPIADLTQAKRDSATVLNMVD